MYMPYDQLPDATDKFQLYEEIAKGANARVHRGKELANDRIVAIKIQSYDNEHQIHIEEEYRTLRDYSSHKNIPDFYGAYKMKKTNAPDEIWFIIEYCDAGNVMQLVNKLLYLNRKLNEEHIAYIIREVCRAAVELHSNHIMHRDIKGSNILLTKKGLVKLCDFGLSRAIDSTVGKRGTCIGSPCWMAPELVTAFDTTDPEVYDSRVDVWALGITTIELADGKPPFSDMHPTRAMFQIVRNPPPTLFKPTNWSQVINDFISECLEKNPENRPMMMEMVEHPFMTELFDNESDMQEEIKTLLSMATEAPEPDKIDEVLVDRGYIKKFESEPEKMYSEDLAGIENPVEEVVLDAVRNRCMAGSGYSFIGDILLSVNTNDLPKEFPEEFHARYRFKSRSENSPHIFSVADIAYQDMMHHKEPQHVMFCGESFSGKSTNARLLIKHLCYLGNGNRGATERVENSTKAVQMLINAGTPINNDSTRCIMQYFIAFGNTGKMSGAVYNMYMLEKMRVSTTDMNQHNFHIFYYLYDFMNAEGKLKEYHLQEERNHRYLRIPPESPPTKLKYVRDDPTGNVEKYREFERILGDLDFNHKQIETIRKMLSAILNIGNIRFQQNGRHASIENPEVVTKIAELLRVDEKKFVWSLTNYIKVKGGIAERKQYSSEEARDSRDAVASTIYNRLVDWIINKINMNMAFPRAVFGDANTIVIYDLYGFECFHRNGFEQLMINTINEQMQYHYNQRIFVSEMLEQEADGIPTMQLNFYDNKSALDNLLTKPDGLFYIIDEASRTSQDQDQIMDRVAEKKSQFVKKHSNTEVAVSHYTGRLLYDTRAFVDINRDFVPPEMIEALRSSLDENTVMMFTNMLTKAGNLTMPFENKEHKQADGKRRAYIFNTLSLGHISQVNNLRTMSANFRYTCLTILKTLSQSQGLGMHFVRCVRADLDYQVKGFHPEMVQQQLKALGVMDTIIARQKGYSCRISFQEFLKRYQFLAFDFDETVDITKDNCRLLLVRLKMEGWAIGKSKVFLRYYNDEFLARLYEVQVKKIIKVQSMMRALIARKKMAKGVPPGQVAGTQPGAKTPSGPEADIAAATIQKAYRGFRERQKYGPLYNEKTGQINEATANFVRNYAKKWRERSIFQVLLHYRAARFQDLVNLSQQVHIYNQRVVAALSTVSRPIPLEKIDKRQINASLLGPMPIPTKKLPFRLDQIPFYDTSYMCNPVSSVARTTLPAGFLTNEDEEAWDSPLQRNPSLTTHLMTYNAYKKEQACQTNWDRIGESDVVYNQTFLRDPHLMRNRQNYNFQSNYPNPQQQYNQNYYGVPPQNQQYNNYNNYRPNYTSTGTGSRRNSLKSYPAPPPPPPMPPMNMMRDDASRMNANRNQNFNNYNRAQQFIPNKSDPVRELQSLGRRSSMDTSEDEPPFNFKAMLRKTNYSRPENNNVEYNSRTFNSSTQNNAMPKLRPTSGQKNFGNTSNTTSYNRPDANFNRPTKPVSSSVGKTLEEDSSATTFKEAGAYVEEEIAPGVTLAGYAIDI
ncbi:neither inactivation nor afterpotential protein C isoform X1 [Eupeodes corollae]|uniref:neither inactivation nor afterpotential protein C isoform X1 n=1 Tax=Eupeodes corollae TaxID=290404 RepID=UPI00249119E1|nr:neither inactivation nor afterpotential protein C isoform X1 [Eupeodes corollae]